MSKAINFSKDGKSLDMQDPYNLEDSIEITITYDGLLKVAVYDDDNRHTNAVYLTIKQREALLRFLQQPTN